MDDIVAWLRSTSVEVPLHITYAGWSTLCYFAVNQWHPDLLWELVTYGKTLLDSAKTAGADQQVVDAIQETIGNLKDKIEASKSE